MKRKKEQESAYSFEDGGREKIIQLYTRSILAHSGVEVRIIKQSNPMDKVIIDNLRAQIRSLDKLAMHYAETIKKLLEGKEERVGVNKNDMK